MVVHRTSGSALTLIPQLVRELVLHKAIHSQLPQTVKTSGEAEATQSYIGFTTFFSI